MTTKQKAIELVAKYQLIQRGFYMPESIAKVCAKITVDEILDEVIYLQEQSEGIYGAIELFTRHSYWEEVKKELEKL